MDKFKLIFQVFTAALLFLFFTGSVFSQSDIFLDVKVKEGFLLIPSCSDFEITGKGTSVEWEKAGWVNIPQRTGQSDTLITKAKVLYSESGIYFLFDCEDKILTATMTEDNLRLWEEDVVEVFLWPEESFPVYFEYQISPLNYQLTILVPNNNGNFFGWLPWQYEGERKTRHETFILGGEKKSGALISGWMAEFYIPYALLTPLGNVPPTSGTRWRANMYRIDRDDETRAFSWQRTEGTFHDIKNFGTFIFK